MRPAVSLASRGIQCTHRIVHCGVKRAAETGYLLLAHRVECLSVRIVRRQWNLSSTRRTALRRVCSEGRDKEEEAVLAPVSDRVTSWKFASRARAVAAPCALGFRP